MTAQTVAYIDPTRPKARRRPLKAWHHMRQLIANKEDTAQVFHIIEALNGNATRRDFARFCESVNGPELLKERAFLPPILDDHTPLRDLPENTVGRAYIAFMEREGLSANGLVEESLEQRKLHQDFDDDLAWYGDRLRDTHDLYHVLTGYGRDALGEAALLGYTWGQHKGAGLRFISSMGGRQISKAVSKDARIKDVIAEGRRNGKAAQRIIEQDIPALLREPIDAARKRLGIAKPVLYRRALKLFAEQGVDAQRVAA